MGEISDGYHTFNELYYYRMLYNAAFFNLLPKEWVHKSKRHHTGEECFGGGWFIVMANLPTGQISNHYELKDWDLFKVPEKEFADEWDGHTPQEAAERLHKYLQQKPTPDTDILHTKLVNLLKKYRIGKETAITIADRIADTYGTQRYMDGLCDGLNKENMKQEQSIQVNTLTWRDINDLERIINNVHYEFRNGISEKGFGEEVLERFMEEKDEQEQPEVDLDEEINRFWDSCIKHKNERGGNVIWSNKLEVEVLANYFFNLGLNARK